LQASWNKYGENNFKFEIINTVETRDEATEQENIWITSFRSINKCFNLTMAGNVTDKSDITRKKLSNAHKGNKFRLGLKHTQESKRKMSISGGWNPIYLEHPEHGIVLVSVLAEFCRKYNLDPSTVSKLARKIGSYKSYHNWKLKEQ